MIRRYLSRSPVSSIGEVDHHPPLLERGATRSFLGDLRSDLESIRVGARVEAGDVTGGSRDGRGGPIGQLHGRAAAATATLSVLGERDIERDVLAVVERDVEVASCFLGLR